MLPHWEDGDDLKSQKDLHLPALQVKWKKKNYLSFREKK